MEEESNMEQFLTNQIEEARFLHSRYFTMIGAASAS